MLSLATPAGTQRTLELRGEDQGRLVLLQDDEDGLPIYLSAHTKATCEFLEVSNLPVPGGWSVVLQTRGTVPEVAAQMTVLLEPYPTR